MQRTFRSRFHSQSEQSRSNINRRTPSMNTKSPQQLLDLIKLRRSRIKTDLESTELDTISTKHIQLVLPKIHSSKNKLLEEQISYYLPLNRMRTGQEIEKEQQTRKYKTIEMESVLERKNQRSEDSNEFSKGIQKIRNILLKPCIGGRDKGLDYIVPLVDYLVNSNCLFKNMPKMMIFSILSKSYIRFYEAGNWVYKKNHLLTSFYIILCGKVKLVNTQKNFRKVSITGETLCQHVLFKEWHSKNPRNEGAKTSSDCYLLEVPYDVYLKLSKDLILQGYRSQFLTLETMIKRNFIQKQKLKQE